EVEGALAHLHGSIVDQREIGTHYVFFVQINEIRNTDTQAPALLYFRRQFKSLA
ncbi:flavin reductase family protein, partial [Neisseria sp. P0001.S005]